MQNKFTIPTLTLCGLMMIGCSSMEQKTPTTRDHSKHAAEALKPSIAPDSLMRFTKGWPEESRQAAEVLMEKYGSPAEWTPSHLTWNAVSPFKRISVYREQVTHRFPVLHKDIVEHVISYRIPVERVEELAKFDGSVSYNRTLGELCVRGNDESMNILALNLASDILRGKKDFEEARLEYGRLAVDFLNGNNPKETEALLFAGQNETADADISPKMNWAQAQEERPKDAILRQAQEEELTE